MDLPLGPSSVDVYLPNPESDLSRRLIIGSAIVGFSQRDGTILIYYEGNRFNLSELKLYRQRAEHAAARMLFNYPHGYPTRARDRVHPREIEPIGIFDRSNRHLQISRPAVELAWWISEADLLDLGVISASPTT